MISPRSILGLGLIVGLVMRIGVVGAAAPLRQDRHIEYGQIVQGRLDSNHAEEVFGFTGRAGDVILVDMQATENVDLDTFLTILDEQGEPLISDDDSGERFNARIGPFELPADGEYAIVAARFGGFGEYTLQLENLLTVPVIALDKPLVGKVDRSHPNDFFRLVVDDTLADSLLRLQINDQDPQSDPSLALYGPAGLITSARYEAQTVIDPFVPEPDVTYMLAVSWNTVGPGGPYELVFGPSEVELLEDGVMQTATYDPDARAQWHYFRADVGQTVRVNIVVTEGGMVPALGITTTDHDVDLFINEGDMVRGLSVLLDIPRDAVYIVEVRDVAYQDDPSTYTITVEWVG